MCQGPCAFVRKHDQPSHSGICGSEDDITKIAAAYCLRFTIEKFFRLRDVLPHGLNSHGGCGCGALRHGGCRALFCVAGGSGFSLAAVAPHRFAGLAAWCFGWLILPLLLISHSLFNVSQCAHGIAASKCQRPSPLAPRICVAQVYIKTNVRPIIFMCKIAHRVMLRY